MTISKNWTVDFLTSHESPHKRALVILNQPFSFDLLERVWDSSHWHCCADGGANRLLEVTAGTDKFIPDLIKGDLDSLKSNVQQHYSALGVPVIKDPDQDSTDLMKCIASLEEKEARDGQRYDIVILGGLAGRLDQTIHLLSYLHKLRKSRDDVFAVTDDNIGWVLDSNTP
ncbi:thiamine pyrophosphokinase [Paramarasmius palmivorus]|uniref:Thiamine pyrophosphokinase n=1 Tax=Paramarasmius palmivorus TaxID=297713 RepID=A0AAW0CVL6_9AGAR